MFPRFPSPVPVWADARPAPERFARRFTSSFKARLSNPFYSRPPFPSPDSRSVLAVKGPLRRFAPWTAPGRSGETRCSRGKRGGRAVWNRIREAYSDDIGLDLFFAGHGEEGTGNLVLKDGTLSPSRLLKLQADDVGPHNGGQRTIGVWLDSCYSGAFLLRLAIESFEHFEGFRLDEGLASWLPDERCDERCYEMDILEHGVFTYTRRHPGNAHVNRERFNRAIPHNDQEEIAKGLQGLVGTTSNSSAFLTQGEQFSMSLMKHVISVDGGFAEVELGEKNDFTEVSRQLTNFKNAPG